jgi:hypothetical protein
MRPRMCHAGRSRERSRPLAEVDESSRCALHIVVTNRTTVRDGSQMRSDRRRAAALMISSAGLPIETSDFARIRFCELAVSVASMNARSSLALRFAMCRSCRAAAAGATNSGSFAYVTINVAFPGPLFAQQIVLIPSVRYLTVLLVAPSGLIHTDETFSRQADEATVDGSRPFPEQIPCLYARLLKPRHCCPRGNTRRQAHLRSAYRSRCPPNTCSAPVRQRRGIRDVCET